jgi:hypothetical protein
MATRVLFGSMLLVGYFAAPVNASPLTFTFTGSSGNVSSIVQTQGGTTLTATPIVSPFPGITITSTAITQDPTLGIGVTWSGTFLTFPISDTDPQIDNFGPNEALQFAFSGNGPWRLDSITLSAVGIDNESFALSVNGNPVNVAAFNPFGANGTFTINLSTIPEGQRTGTLFVISPAGILDDFRVVSLQVTEIPEPATLGVLGLALVGLGGYYRWARRRPVNCQ